MTQQRRDSHSTEYGLWTRKQKRLDSSLGFVATNIDWIWTNYKSSLWMMKEEKRYGSMPRKYQVDIYKMLDTLSVSHPFYRGFHCVIFENTNPDDGRIYLDGKIVSTEDYTKFLAFEQNDDWYKSWFPLENCVGIDFSKIVAPSVSSITAKP